MSKENKTSKNNTEENNKIKRSEIIFLYDISNANPNGDPLDENKPRMDNETGINLVTDVRLKRTIRDYLSDYKKEEIFVKEKENSKGDGIQDGKERANDFIIDEEFKNNGFEEFKKGKKEIEDEILKKCIDIRLFGATIPLGLKIKDEDKPKTGVITLTGPVQFRMGHSLNKVKVETIKGTGAFASSSSSTGSENSKDQKSFSYNYILPYSLIIFTGIINNNVADKTNLTNEDINLLLEGMWNGTKNLITRSKFGQMPRLLLQIEYKEDNFFIGDLDNKIVLDESIKDSESLRNISEVTLNYEKLIESLKEHNDKIEKIRYKIDNELKKEVPKISEENLKDKFEEISFDN